MKRIAETLAVARYNLVERAVGKRPKHGPQTCAGDADIRRLMDTHLSSIIPAIAAVLKREPRATIASTPSGSPTDEEARPPVGSAYRTAHPAGARRNYHHKRALVLRCAGVHLLK